MVIVNEFGNTVCKLYDQNGLEWMKYCFLIKNPTNALDHGSSDHHPHFLHAHHDWMILVGLIQNEGQKKTLHGYPLPTKSLRIV